MPHSRQLAAIMFTDIVGYTALMGKDEQIAFELLKKNRSIQRPIIEKFNGRWLKEIGDGVLASFPTVTDAVYCAATIQKTCENEPDLKLRIGINLGEVVFEGEDVFGDGVNIAARLEPLAPIGGILVSESVNRNIGNKANIVSTFLREEQLRNVTEPIKIYAVQIDNVQPFDLTQDLTLKDSDNQKVNQLTKWTIGSISAILLLLVAYLFYSNSIPDNVTPEMPGKELANSIVVLPFENLSNDPEQDYFGIGMMDEILNKLVKINGLKVISRTTAMGYHGKDLTANEIAQELGVATVLEGSVRKEGDQVRIHVQLIDGASDTHLFSESYDRQLNDIFQLQSEVAQKVANSLTAQISPEVKLNLEAIPTKNMVAYELYLRGREQMGLYWMGSPFTQPTSYVDESIKYYKQAIELDPGFSNAYVGLGQCYWTLAHFSRDYDPVYWDSSKLSLQQAIKLDPNNGWAYSELGVVQHNWDWDKQAAINSFQTAVKLSPSDANVHNNLYYFYLRTGNCEEAEVEASTAYALWNSDYDPELDFQLMQCRGDLEQISRFKNPGLVILMFQEKYQEVVNRVTGSDSVGPLKVVLGEALALSGDSLGAVNKIKELEQLSMTSYLPTIAFAPIYMALGDREKAFEMLEKGLKERDYRIHFAHTQSISLFKAKGDPRYQSITKRSWIPKE